MEDFRSRSVPMPTAVADPRRVTGPARGPGVLTKGMGRGRENGWKPYEFIAFSHPAAPGCQKDNEFIGFLKKKMCHPLKTNGILLFLRSEFSLFGPPPAGGAPKRSGRPGGAPKRSQNVSPIERFWNPSFLNFAAETGAKLVFLDPEKGCICYYFIAFLG